MQPLSSSVGLKLFITPTQLIHHSEMDDKYLSLISLFNVQTLCEPGPTNHDS